MKGKVNDWSEMQWLYSKTLEHINHEINCSIHYRMSLLNAFITPQEY